MAIKYRFEENQLKPGTFYARVIPGETYDLDAMIPSVVDETSLSGTDVKAVIDVVVKRTISALADGLTVVVNGLVTLSVSLSGSFDTNDVPLTKGTAHLNVVAHDDRALEAAVTARATYTQEVTVVKAPVISSVFDVGSGAYNTYSAPGIARLKGKNLKFNPANSDEGVFLDDGTTETRLTIYSVVADKQIDAMLLAGLSGDLTVTVRARYTEGGSLRQTSYQHSISPA